MSSWLAMTKKKGRRLGRLPVIFGHEASSP